MNLLKILTILVSFIYFCIPAFNPSQPIKQATEISFNLIENDNWVMEFHDGRWWWVLYNEDGAKIMEIPVEF